MTEVFATLLVIGLITFLLLVIAGRRRISRNARFVVLVFSVFFIDNLAITLTNHYPRLQLVPNRLWGGFLLCCWSGKAYSILIVLFMLIILRSHVSFAETGISLRQNPGSLIPSFGIIFVIALWSSILAWHAPKGQWSTLTLLYLAVMPGLNEELVYRGFLPACLDHLFPKNWTVASARIDWGAVISTVLFGLLHGLWFNVHLEPQKPVVLIRNALLSGCLFAWLRERTGSLVMPVLAHGAWDFFLFLFRMI